MRFSIIKLILAREIRDQMRDRRTLFMIVVLPILLYPLLGMSFFQIAQFIQEQPARVLVIGAEKLTDSPALFENGKFAARWFSSSSGAGLIEVEHQPLEGIPPAESREDASQMVKAGIYDAALIFPPDFASRLKDFRKSIADRAKDRVAGRPVPRGCALPKVPDLDPIYNTSNQKTPIASQRLTEVLSRWKDSIGEDNLAVSGISSAAVRPFSVGAADVADVHCREAVMWAKVLPVLLMIWALTGAFYPAIDLCAGEKERGTLETLLSSPAQRGEIVVGKLLTIMIFSIFSALLNLLSVGVTSWAVMSKLPGFGLPSTASMIVLAISLVPIAALFSALSLALAAFARSTKEGQYYLMPLLLITLPLVVLPMSPGVELNVGNSLIPITGIVLLLRSMLEGNYLHALQFAPAVAAVTLATCILSIRWAVEQFNSESVLFRESERLDLGLWLRSLIRDRQPTPTAAAAVCCGSLILVIHFFLSVLMTTPNSVGGLARSLLIPQLVFLSIALLLTFTLTNSPRQTLLLKRPINWWTVPAAALLAIVLHPAVNWLQVLVLDLYKISPNVQPALEQMSQLLKKADWRLVLLLIAVTPALCEEIAFRGFVLSGLRHLGHKWRAVFFSALLFGFTHGILQQSIIASLVGMVIGFLAVQSGCLLPCMVYHVIHNALGVLGSRITPEQFPDWPMLWMFVTPGKDGGCEFGYPAFVAGSLAGLLLLIWFGRLPCPNSPEAVLEETIRSGETNGMSVKVPSPLGER